MKHSILVFVLLGGSAGTAVAGPAEPPGPAGLSPAPAAGDKPAGPPPAGGKAAAAADNPAGESEKKMYLPDRIATSDPQGFFGRLLKDYAVRFTGREKADDGPEPARRAKPSPWNSPPFPGSEYQGYPLLGVPYSTSVYPIMNAIYGANTPFTDAIKESRIKFDGWATTSGNFSTAKNSNVPTSYWIVPNRYELDQLIFRLERLPDTVQTDHVDYGFRFVCALRHGLPVHHGRRLRERPTPEAQPALRLGSDRDVLQRLHPRPARRHRHPRRPLDRLPGHRNPIRAGQLPRQPFDSLHLRHLHPDGRHGEPEARRPVDGPGGRPRGHRHGPVVQGIPVDGGVRRPLGVQGQQRRLLHVAECHQQRRIPAFRAVRPAAGARQLQLPRDHVGAPIQQGSPHEDRGLLTCGSGTPKSAAPPVPGRPSPTAAAAATARSCPACRWPTASSTTRCSRCRPPTTSRCGTSGIATSGACAPATPATTRATPSA